MDLVGETVNDRYRLGAVLGTGGMATVYRATDRLLSRMVALKLLAPELAQQGNFLERFQAEAHAMMRLHHPNVVAVFDYGGGEYPFIAMELVKGGSVRALLERTEPPTPEQAFAIIDGVLSGLVNIHASGTIHRDIKPANILLTESGTAKLTDFGIARASERDAFQTRTGAFLGTPEFMAPEQRNNATSVTEASDLYSVGATLYTLLTGRSTADLYVREQQDAAFHDLDEGMRAFLAKTCSFNTSDRFSNASEMQAAFRHVRASSTPERSPILATGAAPKAGNLPPLRDAFVGRSHELAQLASWADSEASRVMSIVGLGGIGKSRLALEFGHHQSQWFSGGVWRIDLSAVQSEGELHRAFGAALGLPLDGQEPLAAIARHLNTKPPSLVIVDNAEDARPVLKPSLSCLIDRVESLRVIVTTREEMSAGWESVLGLRELELRASVALLMQAAGRTIDLANEAHADAQAFEDIARLLEGHPLSLELAAAQLDLLAPAQLNSRLTQSLHTVARSEGPNLVGLLDTAWNDSPTQPSVQASLAWSWSLLSESEQSALAQCALFVSGFDVEAAEAVVRLTDSQAPPLMVLLQGLRSRNLIRVRTPGPANRRLSVPRLVGAFALTNGQPNDLEDARFRMAQHFARMGDEEWIHRLNTGGVRGRRIAKLDVPNIQHCFDWAMEHHQPELSARLSLATSALLVNSGPFGGVADMLRRVSGVLDRDQALRARVLLNQGRLAVKREGLDVAEPLFRECIQLADALNLASGSTRGRLSLAYVLARTHRLQQAMPMAQAAVDIATAADDQRHLPDALYCRGHLTNKSGEPRAASTDLQAALRGYQRLGDRVREGVCLGDLGEYHHYAGDSNRAKECYENAQMIALEQDDKASLVRIHRRFAWLHMDAGDWVRAEQSVRLGLRVAQELGDLPGEASMVGTLGTVAASSGNFESALTQFEEADRMYRAQGDADQRHSCRVNICLALEKLDRIEEAFAVLSDLKSEPALVPFIQHFVTVLEMKLHIRREDWHTALQLGEQVMGKLEAIEAWDRTISVHAYRAICAAALGNDPSPHLTQARALMKRLNLAQGSQEGVMIAEAEDQIAALQRTPTKDEATQP